MPDEETLGERSSKANERQDLEEKKGEEASEGGVEKAEGSHPWQAGESLELSKEVEHDCDNDPS